MNDYIILSPISLLAAFTSFLSAALAKSVFAHVVVGNTAAHIQDTWSNEIAPAADDLWANRWAQTLEIQPGFRTVCFPAMVQPAVLTHDRIVTWNDFGEAHYIGPMHYDSEIAAGSAQFVDGFAHELGETFCTTTLRNTMAVNPLSPKTNFSTGIDPLRLRVDPPVVLWQQP